MALPILGFGYFYDANREELLLKKEGRSVGEYTPEANGMEFVTTEDGFEYCSIHSTATLNRAVTTISAAAYIGLDTTGDDMYPAIITDWIFDRLSPEAQKAFVYHEVGHFVHGHVGQLTGLVDSGAKGGWCLQEEAEADAYAASAIGVVPMVAALNEAKRLSKRMLIVNTDCDEYDLRIRALTKIQRGLSA